MQLSDPEILAINLLKPHTDIIGQVLVNNGRDIDINRVYAFYEKLARQLEIAKARRKTTYTDVEFETL